MRKIDLSLVEISANGRNVRYDGRALDKRSISDLIHDLAFQKSVGCFPLWSDILWYSSSKIELVNYLLEIINK